MKLSKSATLSQAQDLQPSSHSHTTFTECLIAVYLLAPHVAIGCVSGSEVATPELTRSLLYLHVMPSPADISVLHLHLLHSIKTRRTSHQSSSFWLGSSIGIYGRTHMLVPTSWANRGTRTLKTIPALPARYLVDIKAANPRGIAALHGNL